MLRILFFTSSVLCLLTGAGLTGCGPAKFDTPEDMQAHLSDPDHGFVRARAVGQSEVKVTYRPVDLVVWQEWKHATVKNDSLLKALRANFGQNVYFILSFSQFGKDIATPAAGQQAFNDRLNILSFRMGEYVQMTTSGKDTIPLADFRYDRTYNLSHSSEVLVAFPREKLRDDEWAQLDLKDIGLGTGKLKFRFSRADLDRAPELDFSL